MLKILLWEEFISYGKVQGGSEGYSLVLAVDDAALQAELRRSLC